MGQKLTSRLRCAQPCDGFAIWWGRCVLNELVMEQIGTVLSGVQRTIFAHHFAICHNKWRHHHLCDCCCSRQCIVHHATCHSNPL